MQTVTVKTKIENGQSVSRGIAIVQYASQTDASEALKRLPFETGLGEIVDVDYYQSMESRQELRQAQPLAPGVQNPLTIEATRTWNEMTGGMSFPSDVYSINKAIVKTLERYEGQLPSMLKATQKKKKSKKAQKKSPAEQKGAVRGGQRRSQSVTAAKRTVSRQSRHRSTTTKDDSVSKTRANSIWKDKKATPQLEYRVKNSEAGSGKDAEQKTEKKKRRRNNRNRKKKNKGSDSGNNDEGKVSDRTILTNFQAKDAITIPVDQFEKLENADEQKQFLGNLLYQWVNMKLAHDCKTKYADQAKGLDESTEVAEEKLREALLALSGRVTGQLIFEQSVDSLKALCKSQKTLTTLVEEFCDHITTTEGKLI